MVGVAGERMAMTEEWRLLQIASSEWRIRDERGQCIADVYTEADAKLMAASKKMAKAIEEMHVLMESHCGDCEFDGTLCGTCSAGKHRSLIDAVLTDAGVKP
jgi:hypothetical protein